MEKRGKSSDADPDPVGSGFIWVRESGSGRIRIHLGPWIRIRTQRNKMEGKAKFKPIKICWKATWGTGWRRTSSPTSSWWELISKVWNWTWFFFFTFERCFKINLVIILTWIRTGSRFIKFCGSGSVYNKSGSATLGKRGNFHRTWGKITIWKKRVEK